MSKDRWPSGPQKTRVVFLLVEDAAEEGTTEHMFETLGWIEDDNALRSALARALKIEGIASGWSEINDMCMSTRFEFVREDKPVTRAWVPAEVEES